MISFADTTRRAARPGTGLRVAIAVSYVVNPIMLTPLTVGLVLGHFRAPAGELLAVSTVTVLFLVAAPLAYLANLVLTGRVDSLEVRERAARINPMVVTMATGAACLIAVWPLVDTARSLVLIILGMYVINVGVSALITRAWKISIHLIGLTGFLATCFFVLHTSWPWPVGPGLLTVEWLVVSLALIPALMWARVRSGAHTPAQVLAGTVFGAVVPLGELTLLRHLFV